MDTQNNANNITASETMTIGDVELSTKNIISQELVNVLYTKEEVALLNEGVSPYEIHTLNELFGKEYIMSEYSHIIHRLQNYNALLKQIEINDNNNNIHKKVFLTGGYFNSAYNKQREHMGDKYYIYPHNKKIDNEILIDLFSQREAKILGYKIDNDLGGGYIFNPKYMVYVDLFNDDSENISNKRGIKEIKIKDDSLRFIALLPNDCVNYVLSGFDDAIIKSYLPLGKEYLNYLANEIGRTTKKGGIITGTNFKRHDLLKGEGMINIAPKHYVEEGQLKKDANPNVLEPDSIKSIPVERERDTGDFFCYEKK